MKAFAQKPGLGALLLCLGMATAQAAPDMVVVGYGGAGQKAQDVAVFQPFSAQDNSKLIQSEYNGEMARIKVMVDTGHVDWDVVQIEGPDLMRGCDEGMYEQLDWAKLGHADQLIPEAAQACGSAALVWSVAIAYDRNKLAKAPTSWADFWDVKTYPGKRGLRKRAVYNLEFALMADGVKVEDVYKVLATPQGVDRAFAKLSELKPYIQWWEAGAQPAQWLTAGDVVMTSTYSGRIAAAAQAGAPLAVVWPGSLYGMDYWAIIKGSKHVAQAKRLIAYANQPEVQVRYVQQIPYGPTNTQAAAALDPGLAQWVPTSRQNLQGALSMDVAFWVDHGDELEERFNAWASK
ncbi:MULTISPECIES: ABC transporter substrate-binding protein [unclassified Pseudomonas]|uniref:ABC transporter substrate-binding protein n=1 Tax=unclassified Pseudomonas TaxID=196821 RepID=UPI0019137E2C|nr:MULTISPECIES: ABC transporter substrate-binding protein [unclassified Pseudomonas]MBK4990659.1 ABC transporter substrate-binding protein [Pseudomonas sp. S36]MBK5007306.1 ABC transporter substrate-binding protein [Pseudomonas sp. S32]